MSAAPLTPYRTVVIAADFSSGSRAALSRLAKLPLHDAPRLHLVHVVPVPTLTPLGVAREMAHARLGRVEAAARKQWPRASVRLEISAGRPADEIARIAGEQGAELIVAGRRGAGGFPRLLLGSTAERLARLATVPLLLVAEDGRAHQRVLFALDVAEETAPITDAAVRLLRHGVRVDVLHVYWAYGEGYLRFGGVKPKDVHRHRVNLREQARDAIEQTAARLTRFEPPGILLVNGDPRKDVPALVRRRKADLVVLGNHAHTAVSRALLGSVAQEVLRHAACDVLLVPVLD